MAVGHFKVSFCISVFGAGQQERWAWVGTLGLKVLGACLPSSPCLHLVLFYKYSEKLPADILT